MNIFTYTHRGAAKAVAAVTMFTLFMSAFPAAFFVAEAAEVNLFGPVSTTVENGTEYKTGAINAVSATSLKLSFAFDSRGLDNGDSFVYGWRSEGGVNQQLGSKAGANGNSPENETGSIDVPLPIGSHIANLEIYITVTGNAADDDVIVTNFKVTDTVQDPEPETPAGPYDGQVLNGQDSVEICHSANGKNYVSNAPNVDAFINLYVNDKNGHHEHEFDIIPPFDYDTNDDEGTYPGKNWNSETEAIWENGCKDPGATYASVTLLKEVTNEDGADLSAFPLMLAGDTYEHNETVYVETKENGATPVVVTEGDVEGYTLTNVSCVENDSLSAAVAIDPVTEVELSLKTGDAYTCTITNEKDKEVVPEVTLVATKIVCEDESLLPNDGIATVDANTAAAFLASTPERTEGCRLEEGWKFQYAIGEVNTAGAPDNAGELESPWVTTLPTGENGQTTVTLTADKLGKAKTISFREVVQDNYLPFTGVGGSNVSAEMYCHTDAANYDNLDWIKGVAVDNTYHCVAWNVPTVELAPIEVCKYEAGEGDADPTPKAGWEMVLSNNKVGEDAMSYELTTGENGCVTQQVDVNNGPWTATEVIPEDWNQVSVTATGGDEIDTDNYQACQFFGLSLVDRAFAFLSNVVIDEPTYRCDFVNEKEVLQCVDEPNGSWADDVVSFTPGKMKNGNTITDPNRTNPDVALGASDWAPNTNDSTGFVSLGYGGSIVLSFNSYVPNVPGADLTVHEATNGNSYPAETATIEVSQDGVNFVPAGVVNNATIPSRTTAIDFDATGLDWITHVRITDTTNPSLHDATSDGFDLDAVKATQQICELPAATIVAHKIVCTDEADLPNWGAGGPAITGTTAADWVAEHDSCSLEPNWEFQWAEADASNPDNQLPGTPFYGAAGAGWNTFGPTDANGMTSVSVPASVLADNAALWVREVLKDGFLPFTYGPGNMTNEDDESAEIYCHTDVANFDNYDRVDGPESGETYHCVAWNYELPEPLVCDPKVNLLANAGFEAPVVTDGAGWDIFDLTTYPALGWMVDFVGAFAGAPEEASLELHAGVNGWLPSVGEQYAELDADWQGPAGSSGEEASVAISQVIPTIPGENYVLSWDFSPRPGTIQPENKLSVLVDGTEVEMNTAAGGANTQWTSDSYSFKATGNTTEISFADIGTPNSVGTLLDNTSLVCQPKIVTQCSLDIVSDETTIVVDTNDFAVATYDNHPSWTAEEEIPGATWIWETEQIADPEGQTVRTFEETFTVNGAQNAELTVGADNTYRIYINDVLFYDRSVEEPNNYQKVKVKTFDITDELIDGENTVQFEVINLPLAGATYTQNPAGVIFKITLDGVSGCEVTTDRDPEPETYEVTGIKWNDLDGDGERGEGEPTLPNWVIYAYNEETDEERMTTTNGDGAYSFSLPAGVWEISEGSQPNWYQTAPALPGICTFNLDEPYLYESLSFVSEVLEDLIPFPVQEGYCAFGNQFREDDDEDDEPEVDVRGSSGGSSAPRCELDVERDGSEVTVSWETSRATSIVLSANGEEVVESSDDDVVDGDSYTMDLTEDTTFELVAKRGSRERTCTVEVPLERPEGQVLGEQVSIVPLGAADAGAGGASTTGFGSLLLAGAYAGRGRRNG